MLRKLGQDFGKLAASSKILNFFDREWNIEGAWKQSLTFKILVSPLRLYQYASDKFADGTNSILDGSKALYEITSFIEDLHNMSSRVYGLFILTFAAVQGLLDIVSGSQAQLFNIKGVIRLILFLAGTMMILINRQVKYIMEGSRICKAAYDYFIMREDATEYARETNFRPKDIKVPVRKNEVIAVAAGVILGMLGHILPLTVFIIVVGGFIGCVLVFWRYEIGVFAVVGAIPLAPTIALLGMILITAAAYGIRLFRDKCMRFRIAVLDYFVVLFGIVLFYGAITSYTVANSMLTLLVHLACITFYFIFVNTIKTKKQLYASAALLVLSTAVISIYGLYQLKTVGATSEAWIDTTLFEDIKARLGSTFENPNVFGEYLVMIIPIAIAMLWGQKNWISRLVTLGLTAIMLVCLVYTYSRGAYIGLMLAFALFAVLRDKRFVILGVIGLMMLPFVLPPSVINRFTSIGNLSDTSSFYRISVWLGSLKIVKDYWPSGIGLGLEPFKILYPKYSLNAAYAHHSHNIYIQLLIETGIAGFLMFFAMIVVYYKTMLSGFYKTKDGFVSTFIIASASGMAGYLAQGMVENIWYNNRVLLTFWVMMALGMAAKAVISKDNEVLNL